MISEDCRKANVIYVFKKLQKEDPINWFGSPQFPVNVMKQLNLETISRAMKDKRVIRSSQHQLLEGNSNLTILVTICNDRLGEGRAADIAHHDFSKDFVTVS